MGKYYERKIVSKDAWKNISCRKIRNLHLEEYFKTFHLFLCESLSPNFLPFQKLICLAYPPDPPTWKPKKKESSAQNVLTLPQKDKFLQRKNFLRPFKRIDLPQKKTYLRKFSTKKYFVHLWKNRPPNHPPPACATN